MPLKLAPRLLRALVGFCGILLLFEWFVGLGFGWDRGSRCSRHFCWSSRKWRDEFSGRATRQQYSSTEGCPYFLRVHWKWSLPYISLQQIVYLKITVRRSWGAQREVIVESDLVSLWTCQFHEPNRLDHNLKRDRREHCGATVLETAADHPKFWF